MDSEFENRLRRQSLRQIPDGWRDEIVGQASSLSPLSKTKKLETGKLPGLRLIWREFFWPHPKAWAGLAAIWVFIFLLNFSTRDRTPALAEKVSPPSPEVLVELKKQQRMFAELMGSTATSDADRPKFIPKPRSESAGVWAV